jgi:hypothetical protein
MWRDGLDGGKVPVRYLQPLIRRRKLNPVSDGEFPFHLPVDAYATQPLGIVGRKVAVLFLHSE